MGKRVASEHNDLKTRKQKRKQKGKQKRKQKCKQKGKQKCKQKLKQKCKQKSRKKIIVCKRLNQTDGLIWST